MGYRTSSALQQFSPEAIADATNMTDNKHLNIQTIANNYVRIIEVYEGGEATSSNANVMRLGRCSTLGATLSFTANKGFGPVVMNVLTVATVSHKAYDTSTTKSQMSATAGHLLDLSFNAFGGIVRWVAAPEEEIWLFGTATTNSEAALAGFTGTATGIMSAHIIAEEM